MGIGEINELRRELELAHQNGRKLESALEHTSKLSKMRGVDVPGLDEMGSTAQGSPAASQNLERIVDLQKTHIMLCSFTLSRKPRSALSSMSTSLKRKRLKPFSILTNSG